MTDKEINPFIIELIELGNEYNSATRLWDKNSTKEDIRENLKIAFEKSKAIAEKIKLLEDNQND